MNKNKNKGKIYEREVAEIFANNFGGSWIRVPNSGGYVGGFNVNRLKTLSSNQATLMTGDIIPPNNFNITIECKVRKEFKFYQLLQNKGSKILNEWINQAFIDFEQNKNLKLYVIIFKPNRCGNYICVEKNFNLIPTLNYINYNYNNKEYLICELNPFLIINKEKIEKLCRTTI